MYAVEVDPSDSGLAVTGGRDDTAYVWSVSSGEVCFHCTGIGFSIAFYYGTPRDKKLYDTFCC